MRISVNLVCVYDICLHITRTPNKHCFSTYLLSTRETLVRPKNRSTSLDLCGETRALQSFGD